MRIGADKRTRTAEPLAYQASALPTELCQHKDIKLTFFYARFYANTLSYLYIDFLANLKSIYCG